MNVFKKVLSEINSFSKKHQINIKINKYKANDLWNEEDDTSRNYKWSQFEGRAGVYSDGK